MIHSKKYMKIGKEEMFSYAVSRKAVGSNFILFQFSEYLMDKRYLVVLGVAWSKVIFECWSCLSQEAEKFPDIEVNGQSFLKLGGIFIIVVSHITIEAKTGC